MRLPRGVSRTPKGWRITISVHGRLHQKRFPPSVPLAAVEADLAKLRTRLRAGRLGAALGTLAGDVKRYLATYVGPGKAERSRHLDLWIDALGSDTWRDSITREDISRVLAGWRSSGLAADTCNKRRTALLALYHALDGKGGHNPVRDVAKFRAPAPLPRGLSYDQIEKAFKAMSPSKTRARLKVMAYTGIRPGQLRQLKPEHWDQRRQHLMVPGTAKGRGTKPYTIPLSEDATKALQEFAKEGAWGSFASAPMARMWQAAATKAKLPAGTVPYDLRHSFGTQIYRMTGDLKVTKELMGHAAITMTERYTLAAVPERQHAAIVVAFTGQKRRAAR